MDPDAVLAIATITVSELLVGVYLANTPQRRHERGALVEAILEILDPIPFTLGIARVHAQLLVDLQRAGTPIGAHDLQIAATALAGGHEVVTANVREFRRVPGLVVRTFASAS